jgi:hypothetical protein
MVSGTFSARQCRGPGNKIEQKVGSKGGDVVRCAEHCWVRLIERRGGAKLCVTSPQAILLG